MSGPKKPEPKGYGILLAFGMFAGLVVGLIIGEPSAGTMGGVVLGALAAIILRIRER